MRVRIFIPERYIVFLYIRRIFQGLQGGHFFFGFISIGRDCPEGWPPMGMPLEFFKMAAANPRNDQNGAGYYAKEQSHLVGIKGGHSFDVRRHSAGNPDPGN